MEDSIHSGVHRTISGEANRVDLNAVEAFKSSIPDLLKEYRPKDIFNLEEAGLQYGVTAKKTLAFKGEACHGKKHHMLDTEEIPLMSPWPSTPD